MVDEASTSEWDYGWEYCNMTYQNMSEGVLFRSPLHVSAGTRGLKENVCIRGTFVIVHMQGKYQRVAFSETGKKSNVTLSMAPRYSRRIPEAC